MASDTAHTRYTDRQILMQLGSRPDPLLRDVARRLAASLDRADIDAETVAFAKIAIERDERLTKRCIELEGLVQMLQR